MGAYEYTALDAAGKERQGVIEGDTPRHVRAQLRERELLPVSISEVAQKESRRQQGFTLTGCTGNAVHLALQPDIESVGTGAHSCGNFSIRFSNRVRAVSILPASASFCCSMPAS